MIDYDYIGAFLFSATNVDPLHMIPDDQDVFDGLADAPPPISGYREANVQGMACWNCGHFTAVGDVDNDGVIDGICNLFEARAEGECTCDRFTAHADLLRQGPHTSWTEDRANEMRDSLGPSVSSVDYADNSSLNEIFLSGAATEEDGLVWKDILRTGNWSHTPTSQGVIERRLQVVRDGKSDISNGIISLSEILANFEDGAVPYVTVPLSDDKQDHKNIARVNTGFVRKLKLVDRDGKSYLQAGIGFTEPEVKEKVLRGTIPDVSAGIPFGVTRRRDNKKFSTVLDHVCLTSKPFVDGLSPFGIAAADSDAELPVESWEEEEIVPPESGSEQRPDDQPQLDRGDQLALSFHEQQQALRNALGEQLRLAIGDYEVVDINSNSTMAIIRHRTSNVVWDVPFKVTNESDRPVRVASVDRWKVRESQSDNPQPSQVAAAVSDELRNAHELRELRLAQPTATGGIHMSVSTPLSLEGVELSDEARNRIQGILTENETLRRQTRESQIDSRISELESLGLNDRPGALKFYRQVMLSDDGGPAIILFSDSDDDEKKERLTALEVLDRFIKAMEADGGVTFSDQALQSSNDNKPPTTAEGETKPLEDRVKDAQTALYGKRNRRK